MGRGDQTPGKTRVRSMEWGQSHKEKGVRSMEMGQTCGRKSQNHREGGVRPTGRQG